MKQMDECLDRFFSGKAPLASKKWKAIPITHGGFPTMCLFHYHHLVLVYDLANEKILHEWHEKPTDKRGLDAAKLYLMERKERING